MATDLRRKGAVACKVGGVTAETLHQARKEKHRRFLSIASHHPGVTLLKRAPVGEGSAAYVLKRLANRIGKDPLSAWSPPWSRQWRRLRLGVEKKLGFPLRWSAGSNTNGEASLEL
jgi:hypothetical protein